MLNEEEEQSEEKSEDEGVTPRKIVGENKSKPSVVGPANYIQRNLKKALGADNDLT